MKDKKATGNDYVSGDVLKLLGKDGLRVMTTHRNIYGTIEPPKDFTAVIIKGGSNMTGTNCDLFTHKSSRSYLNHLVITFKKEAKSYKMQRPSQTSLNAHAEKVIARILRRRIERKIENVLGESDFDLRDEDELEM